jgi:hypothetical protein
VQITSSERYTALYVFIDWHRNNNTMGQNTAATTYGSWDRHYFFSSGEPRMSGVQIGVMNFAWGHMKGVQIGLVNVSKYLTGVQIGLINVVYGLDKALPFFPFINVGFY